MMIEFAIFYWRQKLAFDALRELEAEMHDEMSDQSESVPPIERMAGILQWLIRRAPTEEPRDFHPDVQSKL
jgi:hypothetical protein